MVEGNKVVFLGAGLASCLIAMRLKEANPKLIITILEKNPNFETEKTWSFFSSDIQNDPWVQALASKTWKNYSVNFPNLQKVFNGNPYNSIRAGDFYGKIRDLFKDEIKFNADVVSVHPGSIVLKNGQTVPYDILFDGRGQIQQQNGAQGYQKFLGLEVKTKQAHGVDCPIIMDCCVDQTLGFRFFYILPWTENTLLVEDTYYSLDKNLNEPNIENEIRQYITQRFGEIEDILYKERGVLPIPFLSENSKKHDGFLIGMRGSFYHPVTGYSLPHVARLSAKLSDLKELSPQNIQSVFRSEESTIQKQKKFFLLLNRMLFYGADPQRAFVVLEHFFKLPAKLIENFFAGNLNIYQKIHIFVGRPPIRISRAIRCVFMGPSL